MLDRVGAFEGRQIACDEMLRYGEFRFEDLFGREESLDRIVRAPSGRTFRLTTEVFDDYDGYEEEKDPAYLQGVAIIVQSRGPGRLPIKFNEGIVLHPDGSEKVSDMASRPRTYREEIQDRAILSGCLVLLVPLAIVAIPLFMAAAAVMTVLTWLGLIEDED